MNKSIIVDKVIVLFLKILTIFSVELISNNKHICPKDIESKIQVNTNFHNKLIKKSKLKITQINNKK